MLLTASKIQTLNLLDVVCTTTAAGLWLGQTVMHNDLEAVDNQSCSSRLFLAKRFIDNIQDIIGYLKRFST